ncbi:MAG: class I SAM-dependent methyltransferase [Marmoricola sp.]
MASKTHAVMQSLRANPRLQRFRGDPRVHAVVGAVNTPLAKARARRTFASAPRPIKLEIGGTTNRPGWVITNVNPIADNWLDATVTWPFEDGAIEYLYADNMIEHVSLEAARAMLAEAYRCMKPGGVIRLATPDIRKHVDLYLTGDAAVKSDLADIYRSIGFPVEYPSDLLRITIGQFGHNEGYIYDFESLRAELERAGFTNVVECPVGSSEHPVLDGLDSRVEEASGQMTVEATR